MGVMAMTWREDQAVDTLGPSTSRWNGTEALTVGRASRTASNAPTPSFTSFGGILNSYTGDVKTNIETGGIYSSTSTTMLHEPDRLPIQARQS